MNEDPNESPKVQDESLERDWLRLYRLRARGWRVAVHNDYMQDGVHHTFWLFTRGHLAARGEGKTDGEALMQAEAAATDLDKFYSVADVDRPHRS